MNKSKKIGIAIFLLLIGSLEAGRKRLTNSDDHHKMHKVPKLKKDKALKAPKPPKLSKKKVSKLKKDKAPKAPQNATLLSKKKAERKEKYHQKKAKRKEDRKEAKKRQVYLGEGRLKTYRQEFAYGATYYHKESTTKLLDAIQTTDPANAVGLIGTAVTTDEIEITKSKPALQVSYVLSAVYENLPALFKAGETVEASFGLQASFAKKDDAYQGTYKDEAVVGNLRTRQDIKKYTVQLFGQYELFRYYGWRYNFKLASGLSVGALRDLRIYEEVSNQFYYTGQRMPVKKSRPTVEFGLNVTKEAGPLHLVFGYDVGYVKQAYQYTLVADFPDPLASQVHHNNHVNLRANSVRHLLVATPPVFKLWAFNFKLGAAFDF